MSSKLIFASCVGYFDRAYYGFYVTSRMLVLMRLYLTLQKNTRTKTISEQPFRQDHLISLSVYLPQYLVSVYSMYLYQQYIPGIYLLVPGPGSSGITGINKEIRTSLFLHHGTRHYIPDILCSTGTTRAQVFHYTAHLLAYEDTTHIHTRRHCVPLGEIK